MKVKNKYLSEELKGEVYKALVLPALLYGCEAWSLREDLFKRLRSFFWAPPPRGDWI